MLYLANELGPGEYEIVRCLTPDQASIAKETLGVGVKREATDDKVAAIEQILADEGMGNILVN